MREKGKKEEAKRLREFVDAAWKIDPRVAAHREEERLERYAVLLMVWGLSSNTAWMILLMQD